MGRKKQPADKLGAIRNPDGYWINSSVFSEEAAHYQKYGTYCDFAEGSSGFVDYWSEQLRRITEGHTVGGVRITGPHYQYLNFTPIKRSKEDENSVGVGVTKTRDFPDFWDYDYNYFHSIEIARKGISEEDYVKLNMEVRPRCLLGGHHVIVAKTRRRGYSYKGGVLALNTYQTVRDSLTLLAAYEKKFLHPKGVLTMFNLGLGFLDANTGWAKRREYADRLDHKKASYKKFRPGSGTPAEVGFLSEMMALTFKDNPDASRGGDAHLVLMDEAGAWPGLEQAYKVLQPLCEDGKYISGQIVVFGCVCAGTKVWTNSGNMVNIEDLKKEDGILGFNNQKSVPEPITHMNPPFEKPCYRITTDTGRILECSEDHPILASHVKSEYRKREYVGKERVYVERYKKASWKETKDLKKGDQVAVINAISIFGERKLWEPRLLGLLVGDGSYGFDKTPTLSNADKGIIDYVEDRFDTVTEKEYITKKGTTYKELRLRGICPNLREVGIYGQTKEKKTLPNHINDCDKQTICEFIGGLFDADGYVSKRQIILTSAYESLIREVKDVLIKIGVHGSIYKVAPNLNKVGRIKDKNPYFRLVIGDGDSIINFCKNIKLYAEHKQEALNRLLETQRASAKASRTVFVKKSEKNKSYVDLTDIEGVKFEVVRSVEYIGIKPVYNLTAGNTHTYIANGIITHNTGGDMLSGSMDFAKMFYEPASYNLLAFDNIWDEESEGDTCGFYVPDFKNKIGYIDKQGNSIEDEARAFEERRREVMLAAGKKDAYNQHIQEFSFCPAEAFLITGDNKFPIRELRKHRLWLEKTNKFKGVPVFLTYINGEASYEVDLKGTLSPLYRYGGTPKDTTGAVVMYKKPEKGKKYKGGYDTIQQDEGSSLAAWQIYVDNPLGNDHGEIVMSFYGRGKGPDDCDERLMIAALLYNSADIMHENMFRSTKNNFKMWGKEHLLSSQPDMVIKNTIKDSKVDREYGVHMTDRIKLEACLIGSRRLEEIVGYEEDGTPIMYLNTIRDIRLIEELIRFNTTGNFDAVMAFLMWCISDEESRLLSVVSNTNTKGIGTQFEELRNYRRVHGSLF